TLGIFLGSSANGVFLIAVAVQLPPESPATLDGFFYEMNDPQCLGTRLAPGAAKPAGAQGFATMYNGRHPEIIHATLVSSCGPARQGGAIRSRPSRILRPGSCLFSAILD